MQRLRLRALLAQRSIGLGKRHDGGKAAAKIVLQAARSLSSRGAKSDLGRRNAQANEAAYQREDGRGLAGARTARDDAEVAAKHGGDRSALLGAGCGRGRFRNIVKRA